MLQTKEMRNVYRRKELMTTEGRKEDNYYESQCIYFLVTFRKE